ncbi:MAG: hypothetical protein ACRD1W_08965 [Vicinamibacterales bacterium]
MGALVSFGVAMFACVRYARRSAALWCVLAIAGVTGFAALLFAAGLALSPRVATGHQH